MDIFIDFDIIKNSDLETVKKEVHLLASNGHQINLWSKSVHPDSMEAWCKSNKIAFMFWTFKSKDSFNYPCADMVIDSNERFVNRFIARGKQGRVMTKIG